MAAAWWRFFDHYFGHPALAVTRRGRGAAPAALVRRP